MRLTEAGNWLHSYQLKFGREPNAHPPDAKIVAQILTVAPWPQLQDLLYDLMAERKQPGHSYAWYLTVALQRIHGISPQVQKAQRTALKVLRGRTGVPAVGTPSNPKVQGGGAPAEPPADDEPFNSDEIVADLARVKSMGG